MKKFLLIILLSLITLSSCKNNIIPQNDNFNNDNKEEIRKIKYRHIKTSEYTDGILTDETEYAYDDEGLLISETNKSYASDNANKISITESYYEYDDNNMLIRKTDIKDSSKLITEYEYSEDNLPIKDTIYQDNKIIGVIEREYDEFGSIINFKNSYNDLNISYTYNRDNKGRVIRKDINKNGETETEEYEYAGEGRIAKIIITDNSGNVIIKENEYDEGLIICRNIYHLIDDNPVLYSKSTYEYDNDGHELSETTHYPDDDEKIINSYEYDNNGNLIKELHNNGKIERIFEYEEIIDEN